MRDEAACVLHRRVAAQDFAHEGLDGVGLGAQPGSQPGVPRQRDDAVAEQPRAGVVGLRKQGGEIGDVGVAVIVSVSAGERRVGKALLQAADGGISLRDGDCTGAGAQRCQVRGNVGLAGRRIGTIAQQRVRHRGERHAKVGIGIQRGIQACCLGQRSARMPLRVARQRRHIQAAQRSHHLGFARTVVWAVDLAHEAAEEFARGRRGHGFGHGLIGRSYAAGGVAQHRVYGFSAGGDPPAQGGVEEKRALCCKFGVIGSGIGMHDGLQHVSGRGGVEGNHQRGARE